MNKEQRIQDGSRTGGRGGTGTKEMKRGKGGDEGGTGNVYVWGWC